MKSLSKIVTITLFLLVSSSPAFAGGWNSFKTVIYTGTDAEHSIDGVGFKPDLVWIKCLNNTIDHHIVDSLRGAGNYKISNSTAAEGFNPAGVVSFDIDGFTLGSYSRVNNANNNETYVAWCWKAGEQPVTNTDGTITSTVSANPVTGFSIVKYTGTGGNDTIGHGLGKAPKMIIVKNLDDVTDWHSWHTSLLANQEFRFNTNLAVQTDTTIFNGTLPDDTVFNVGTANSANGPGDRMVSYVWTDIPGFSAMGSYTGTGSATGPVFDLGFQPSFVMIKRADFTGNWMIFDTKRGMSSGLDPQLYADLNNSENLAWDILDTNTNGFEITSVGNSWNLSGGTYIYIAFAEVDPPQISFTADQSSVVYDPAGVTGEVNLSWNVTNAGANPDISISPLGHASTDALGTIADKPEAPTTYTLTVTYEGETFSQDLFVDVTGGFQQGGTTTFTGPVGIGKLNPVEALEVNGTIKAKEILVTMDGYADYVFTPGYKLQDLNSVKSYIQKNGHLPGIPSERNMVQNGLSVSRMLTLQMQKIEELTLHMIRLSQENEALRQEVRQLKQMQ